MSDVLLEQIKEEYWKQLELPETPWDGPQFVLCVAGSVGSGKSTLLKSFANDMGLLVISSDVLRIILKKYNLGYDHLKSLLPITIEHFLDRGYSIAMDMNCGNSLVQTYIPKLEKEREIHSYWMTITLPKTVVEERLKKGRSNFHVSFESALADYEQQSAAENPFSSLHPPFLKVTETTTDSDVKSAISELKTRLLN